MDLAALKVLVVNPGSSSLKLRLLGDDDAIVAEEDLKGAEHEAELERFLARGPEPDAAGVRIVHGGADFTAPVRLDDAVLERLDGLSDLAPLHNPPALRAARALRRLRPELPVAGCFDTAFHSTLAPAAATYAVPWRWTYEWGVRRFGFHGLSHAYIARQARELVGAERCRRLVSCHLGAGASVTAVLDGRSVDTSMGFTPMEGLVMATRSGSVDPGLLLWVQRAKGLDAEQLERALDRESGLLGISGVSPDMREVLEAAQSGNERARLAVELYVHRLQATIGAMAAALGGLDVLAFTGGVGEHSAEIRDRATAGLTHLGVGAGVEVLVIEAREDLQIAREVRSTLAGSQRT